MRVQYLAVLFLLGSGWLGSIPGRAQTPLERRISPEADPQQTLRNLYQTRDYRERAALQPEYDQPHAAAVADGETISYRAIDGTIYTARQFNGAHTAVIVKTEDMSKMTMEMIRDGISWGDFIYAHYAEILGTELPGGLLTIGYVKNCGAGCGWVGAKGIEIDPDFLTRDKWYGNLHFDIIAHEIAHNVDQYNRYLFFGSDTAHIWTEFLQFYLLGYSYRKERTAALFSYSDTFFGPYLRYPNATWERCVRDNACQPEANMAFHTQAGLMFQFARLLGTDGLKQFFVSLRNLVKERQLDRLTLSPAQRNDLLIEAFSQAMAANLACFCDTWKWTLSDSLRAQLAAKWPTSTDCQDRDRDGFTAVQGDLNDNNAAIFPGATEISNGVDDDCNGIIDDVLVTESGDFPNQRAQAQLLTAPSRVRGAISANTDEDHFAVQVTTKTNVRIRLKSLGEFKGWLFLLKADGSWWEYTYVGVGSESELTKELEVGKWHWYVAYNNSSQPGAYELFVEMVPGFVPGGGQGDSNNHYRLIAPTLAGRTTGERFFARFWVNGFGWVGSAPVTTASVPVELDWVAPCNRPLTDLKFQVQFWRDNAPFFGLSTAVPLQLPSNPICRSGTPVQAVSGASWDTNAVAADGLASVFGTPLAPQISVAHDTDPFTPGMQLPLLLAGTSLRLRDSQGVERVAPLLFVSPTQINFLVPRATASGAATIIVTYGGDGAIATGSVAINTVSPALFSADATGKGWAAAEAITIASNGAQTTQPIARFDMTQNKYVPVPIDVSTNAVVLVLYGTGIRQRSGLSNVTVNVGGVAAQVEYAGPQSQYVGLDQINVRLPRSLAGRGQVSAEVIVEGKAANPVSLQIR